MGNLPLFIRFMKISRLEGQLDPKGNHQPNQEVHHNPIKLESNQAITTECPDAEKLPNSQALGFPLIETGVCCLAILAILGIFIVIKLRFHQARIYRTGEDEEDGGCKRITFSEVEKPSLCQDGPKMLSPEVEQKSKVCVSVPGKDTERKTKCLSNLVTARQKLRQPCRKVSKFLTPSSFRGSCQASTSPASITLAWLSSQGELPKVEAGSGLDLNLLRQSFRKMRAIQEEEELNGHRVFERSQTFF